MELHEKDGLVKSKRWRKNKLNGYWFDFRPVVQVALSNEPFMLSLKEEIGVPKIYRHKGNIQKNERPSYILKLFRYADIKFLLETILPFLRLKRRNAELILECISLRIKSRSNGMPKRISEIYEELKILNRRGRSN